MAAPFLPLPREIVLPSVVRVVVKGLTRFVRNGTERIYYRPSGRAIKGEIGSPEFFKSYFEAVNAHDAAAHRREQKRQAREEGSS